MRSSWKIAAAGAILVANAQPSQAQDAGANSGWDRVQACANIAKPSERLRCVDAVIRHPEVKAEPSRAVPPVPATAATPASKLATKRDDQFGRPPPRQPKNATADEQHYVLARVTAIGPARFRFVTDNGETWEQLESGQFTIEPAKGAQMLVRRSALGGYTCRFGRSVAMLCRRTA